MCGRYSFTLSKEKVNKQLGLNEQQIEPDYNICPTRMAYILPNNQPAKLTKMRWGLIPNWANSASFSNNLINAAAEGIAARPSFRLPIRYKRCLVLADGFYEWQQVSTQRLPYRITPLDGNILTFAGIWDIWHDGTGMPVQSFTIITTEPNAEVSALHNRMPALLSTPEARQAWLATDTPLPTILKLLQPTPDHFYRIYPVSTAVNSTKATGEQLFKETPHPPTLFN
jgi:putative SOS response-associated peptidase YedK